jgi:hypothetical protein
MPDRALLQESPPMTATKASRDRQVRPCSGSRTTSARFSIERARKRARQISHSRRLLRPAEITRTRRRTTPARGSQRKPARSWSPKATYFSRWSGCRGLLHCRTHHPWHEAPDRDLGQGIGSVALTPREARRSSEPPIEKPEPGAPRMLGSGVELDADLRDRVPLHVAHD